MPQQVCAESRVGMITNPPQGFKASSLNFDTHTHVQLVSNLSHWCLQPLQFVNLCMMPVTVSATAELKNARLCHLPLIFAAIHAMHCITLHEIPTSESGLLLSPCSADPM